MIIGLNGVKRAGKNLSAELIRKSYGKKYAVQEWSFAKTLKASAAAALGVITDKPEAWADRFKEKSCIVIVDNCGTTFEESTLITGREYLQWYGTEAHRDIFGDDFWIDIVLDPIKEHADEWNYRLDLITDVRFPNEAEAIREAGGAIIKIRRPDVEDTGDTHASEQPLPSELVDYEVWNSGTIHALKENLGFVVDDILYTANFLSTEGKF